MCDKQPSMVSCYSTYQKLGVFIGEKRSNTPTSSKKKRTASNVGFEFFQKSALQMFYDEKCTFVKPQRHNNTI